MLFPPRVPDGARKDTAENGLKSGATGAYESLGNIRVSCMVKGTLRVWIADREKTLFAGDTFLLNAHEEARMTALEDCFYYSVEIDKDKLFDRLCIPALTVFENFVLQDASVAGICRKMNDEYRSQGLFCDNMLNALADELIIHLYRNYNGGNALTPSALLLGKHRIARLAVDYIYKNCVKGITTSEISAQISVSEAYLCRCFKEATGVSILEYAERIRCRKAKEDLSLGIYTATQVAEKYGFNSLSYFSRRYTKYCLENPADTLSKAKKSRVKPKAAKARSAEE